MIPSPAKPTLSGITPPATARTLRLRELPAHLHWLVFATAAYPFILAPTGSHPLFVRRTPGSCGGIKEREAGVGYPLGSGVGSGNVVGSSVEARDGRR